MLILRIPAAVFISSLLSVLLALSGAACRHREALRVQLEAHTPTGPPMRRLEIRAQLTGLQTDLRYKWLSVVGECEPQETDRPVTIFKFADGVSKDRVTVEVWRDNERVAQSELDVRLDREPLVPGSPPNVDREPAVQIEITQIPPHEPEGGDNTRADIAGTVSGELTPDCKVIVYARASDLWFIQPLAYTSHPIRENKTWSTWTHTGSSYAALVVRPGFDPVPRLDVLPKIGGYVLGRTIVEGKKP